MTRHSPLQQIKEAKQIALDHGCFVVEKADKYLVYRKMPVKPVFLGARGTPASLRNFVCKVTNFH